MRRTLLISAALTCFALTTGGCLVTSASSVDEDGTRISRETLRQIEPGVTTEAWLVATLGEPDHRTIIDGDRTRVLRYDFTVNRSSGGTVFLLFAGSSQKTTTTRTFFEVADGVVTRHWTES